MQRKEVYPCSYTYGVNSLEVELLGQKECVFNMFVDVARLPAGGVCELVAPPPAVPECAFSSGPVLRPVLSSTQPTFDSLLT